MTNEDIITALNKDDTAQALLFKVISSINQRTRPNVFLAQTDQERDVIIHTDLYTDQTTMSISSESLRDVATKPIIVSDDRTSATFTLKDTNGRPLNIVEIALIGSTTTRIAIDPHPLTSDIIVNIVLS